jgi:hypothetical protein
MSKWFSASKMSLNLDKKCNKICNNNSPQYPLNIGYNDNYIEETVNTKYFGLQTDDHLNWKTHIDQLVPKLKLSEARAITSMLHVSNTDSLIHFFITFTI